MHGLVADPQKAVVCLFPGRRPGNWPSGQRGGAILRAMRPSAAPATCACYHQSSLQLRQRHVLPPPPLPALLPLKFCGVRDVLLTSQATRRNTRNCCEHSLQHAPSDVHAHTSTCATPTIGSSTVDRAALDSLVTGIKYRRIRVEPTRGGGGGAKGNAFPAKSAPTKEGTSSRGVSMRP